MALLKRDKVNRPFPWILALITGGILLVGTSTYYVVNNSDSQEKLSQLTLSATNETLSVKIQASGTVEPIENVNISPKNPGRLLELKVEQGDVVKKGQILAIMENSEISAQEMEAEANLRAAIANWQATQVRLPSDIKQAEARLNQAKANLQQSQQRIPREVEQAQAQLDLAQSRFILAQERLKRNQYLVDQGAVARDNFDEIQNEFSSAQANLTEAKQRLEQVINTENPEIARLEALISEATIAYEQQKNTVNLEIARLAAAVDQTKAQLEQIKIKLADTIIKAPFDGIITQRYATVGAFVTPTTSASTSAAATSTSIIALAKGLEIIAKVPEVDVGQLRVGQSVDIVADAYPDKVFQGKVKSIAPEAVVEQNVTSFEVKVTLLNGENLLLSKMNVDVTFLGQEISNALVVPTVAIVTQQGKTGVMVLDENNEAVFKPVTIGLTLKDKTQILKGLTSQEKIFIDLPKDKIKK